MLLMHFDNVKVGAVNGSSETIYVVEHIGEPAWVEQAWYPR